MRSSANWLPPPTNRPSLAAGRSRPTPAGAAPCRRRWSRRARRWRPRRRHFGSRRCCDGRRSPRSHPPRRAMASVRSVQRLATTTTSAVTPAVRTAASIAASLLSSSNSSLCAGTMTENLGRGHALSSARSERALSVCYRSRRRATGRLELLAGVGDGGDAGHRVVMSAGGRTAVRPPDGPPAIPPWGRPGTATVRRGWPSPRGGPGPWPRPGRRACRADRRRRRARATARQRPAHGRTARRRPACAPRSWAVTVAEPSPPSHVDCPTT